MDKHLGIVDVLTTTRAVRKRLDFSKPVERKVIEECLAAAQQAPNGGNLQTWGFVVITDRAKRATLADLYRRGYDTFVSSPIAAAMGYGQPHVSPAQRRVMASIDYLVENLHQAPVLVIPINSSRVRWRILAIRQARSSVCSSS
jgi:nitroreductase